MTNKFSAVVLTLVAFRAVAAVLEPTALNEVDHASVRAPLKLSVFSSHVEDIARQEGVSFAEAAAKVRAAGISGITVMDGLAADRIAAAGRRRKRGAASEFPHRHAVALAEEFLRMVLAAESAAFAYC